MVSGNRHKKKMKRFPKEMADYFHRRGQSLPEACIICSEKPYSMGLWPMANRKLAVYALCRRCFDNQPESAETVEKIIGFGESA